MLVGVLAFQGDFAEHLQVLSDMGVACVDVRNAADLAKVSRLIIPGGESTVIAQFLTTTGMGREIRRRVLRPGKNDRLAVYGTCAGAILLGRRVTGKNAPSPLGLIDIDLQRNAYGEQLDSFQADLKVTGIPGPIRASFIRAPKITRVGKAVEVLAKHDGLPVLVRQGNVLVGTFHPEVRGEKKIHELFVGL
ncbi:MAG TPA: pyridoxal 5'-phosphate synthase glutaminase subunit PdxT [Candidatus Peribacteria bacterium]|nr:pyridoxal 5'-phosphate synthase glutaminase subunit PdxT [Candidatus Peribacteria bacterium]